MIRYPLLIALLTVASCGKSKAHQNQAPVTDPTPTPDPGATDPGTTGPGQTDPGSNQPDTTEKITELNYNEKMLGKCKDRGKAIHFGFFGEGAHRYTYIVCPTVNNIPLDTCLATFRSKEEADSATRSEFKRVINSLCHVPFGGATKEEYKKWLGVDPTVAEPPKDESSLYQDGETRCVGFSYQKNGKTCFSEVVCDTREGLQNKLKAATRTCS